MPKSTHLTVQRIGTLTAGTRAKNDDELVKSWLASLTSAHTHRNFETTGRSGRFLSWCRPKGRA